MTNTRKLKIDAFPWRHVREASAERNGAGSVLISGRAGPAELRWLQVLGAKLIRTARAGGVQSTVGLLNGPGSAGNVPRSRRPRPGPRAFTTLATAPGNARLPLLGEKRLDHSRAEMARTEGARSKATAAVTASIRIRSAPMCIDTASTNRLPPVHTLGSVARSKVATDRSARGTVCDSHRIGTSALGLVGSRRANLARSAHRRVRTDGTTGGSFLSVPCPDRPGTRKVPAASWSKFDHRAAGKPIKAALRCWCTTRKPSGPDIVDARSPNNA